MKYAYALAAITLACLPARALAQSDDLTLACTAVSADDPKQVGQVQHLDISFASQTVTAVFDNGASHKYQNGFAWPGDWMSYAMTTQTLITFGIRATDGGGAGDEFTIDRTTGMMTEVGSAGKQFSRQTCAPETRATKF